MSTTPFPPPIKALEAPKRPLVAIVGGAKISSKLDLLSNLVAKVDALVIGGGMANTFLNAQGYPVGKSLCEKDLAETARAILAKAQETRCAILLPIDAIVAFQFAAHAPAHDYGVDAIPEAGMMLDIGQLSIDRIKAAINEAETVVWNGPLGAFELAGFEQGTYQLAHHVAERTKEGKLVSVAGGGDTVAALNGAGVAHGFSYVSTAGGAFLEWMEGKALPGVEALRR
jgi:phosphoglycerate kinase